MDSTSHRWLVALAFAFSTAACGDDGATSNGTSDDTESSDDDDDDDDDDAATLPTTTAMSSSGSSSSTDATETQTGTGSDTTAGSDTTVADDSTSSSDSSSSSTGEDIDLVCEGPAGNDTCDNPSPFDGAGDCDPYAQNCPEGEKCLAWASDGGTAWDATRCSPLVPMPAQLGEDCSVEGSGVSGVDDCDVGLMCWGVDPETNTGTCNELCGCGPEEPTCAGGGTICAISNENALTICLGTCDPLVADACADGQGCYPVENNFLCAPDASGGAGAQGDACQFVNACGPGFMCVTAALLPGCGGATGCCTAFCDLDTGNADCSDPATDCTAFFPAGTEPEECHVDTGICLGR